MIKNILFDFDGVILDSMEIRDYGFKKIVSTYPKEMVDDFIKYHRYNAGLSRFVKIKYFYNHYLDQEISKLEIQVLADKFSKIMREKLPNKKYLIKEALDFIKQNNSNMHIVSGSEEKELNFLCNKLEIYKYFKTIEGSPTPKVNLVKNIMLHFNYEPRETILIGDSINDYEAAKDNYIDFYGYNNKDLIKFSKQYIYSFQETFKNIEIKK